MTSYEEILKAFDILGKDDHVGLHGVTCTPQELEKAYRGARWYLLYNPPFGNVLNVTYALGEFCQRGWRRAALGPLRI